MTHEWYVKTVDEIIGPLTPLDVRRLVREHSISRDTLIRRDDRVDFIAAGLVGGLFPKVREDEATTSWKQELGIPEGQGLFHEEPSTQSVKKARATAAFRQANRRRRPDRES